MARHPKIPLEDLQPYMLPDVPRGSIGPAIDWRELFQNDHPVEIEVGFGKGLFLTTSATAHPGINYFGVEIERKYQLLAAGRLHRMGLHNVRVACGDGKAILRDRIAPQSVQAVHVYFPDPWWKTRHRKRRVFTPDFVRTIGTILAPGGQLRIATDVETYFGVMNRIVHEAAPAFAELPPPPPREGKDESDYLTNFERKFRKQGRPIYRAAYQRTLAPLPEIIPADPGLAGPFTEFDVSRSAFTSENPQP